MAGPNTNEKWKVVSFFQQNTTSVGLNFCSSSPSPLPIFIFRAPRQQYTCTCCQTSPYSQITRPSSHSPAAVNLQTTSGTIAGHLRSTKSFWGQTFLPSGQLSRQYCSKEKSSCSNQKTVDVRLKFRHFATFLTDNTSWQMSVTTAWQTRWGWM